MEVFEHEQERLDPRLAHERAPGRLERRLPPLRGIEALPSRIVHGHVEQREQRRQRGLERAVERHDLAEHLLADVPMRIALTDPEVRPEEIDDGQVAGRLAIGDGAGLEDQPAVDTVRMSELEHQPRFPDAGLPDAT